MTDISALEAYAGTLSEAAQRADAASEKQHEYIHGDDQTDVVTESGLVPTLAKQSRLYGEAIPDAVTALSSQMADGRIYASEAIGRPLVANGQFFYARSTDTRYSRTLWQRVDASSSTHIADDPSAALVDELDGRTTAIEDGDFSALGLRMVVLAPDTGYAWALMDKNNRAAILVKLDATVEIPKYSKNDYIATYLNPDTGYVWVIKDKNDKILLGITTLGKVVGNFEGMDFNIEGTEYLLPSTTMLMVGDSLAGLIHPFLVTAFPDRTVVNAAIGGQTSPQIAARVGASFGLLTVPGNQIPASGAVTISDLSLRFLSTPAANSGTTSRKGWLAGVYGTLTCVNDATDDVNDVYTFTRDVAGSAVYCSPAAPFVPDLAGADFGTVLILVGRNNVTDTAQIMADIDSLVALCKTAKKQFIIFTPPNGGPLTAGVSTGEGTGSSVLNSIKAVEAWASKKYGDRVIKTREYSFQFNDGSADDLDDVAKETVPRSLRTDAIHWGSNFSGLLISLAATIINGKGW